MKISEMLREGAKLNSEGSGAFFTLKRDSYLSNDFTVCTCALGAIYRVAFPDRYEETIVRLKKYFENSDRNSVNETDLSGKIEGWGDRFYKELHESFPELQNRIDNETCRAYDVLPHFDNDTRPLSEFIWSLNDRRTGRQYDREELANILEKMGY